MQTDQSLLTPVSRPPYLHLQLLFFSFSIFLCFSLPFYNLMWLGVVQGVQVWVPHPTEGFRAAEVVEPVPKKGFKVRIDEDEKPVRGMCVRFVFHSNCATASRHACNTAHVSTYC